MLIHTLIADRFVRLIWMSLLVFIIGSTQSKGEFGVMRAAYAQSSTATLTGTVVDDNGAVIPNIDVTVTNADTRQQRSALTNSTGYFLIPLLPPGSYNVMAQHEGFATLEMRNVVLSVNHQRTLKLQLKVGQISESVIVDNASLINSGSVAVQTTIDRGFVENLPLNGRSFSTLIELTPGVVLTKTQGQFSVNGQRSNANYFMVDGVSANVAIDPYIQISQTAGGTIPAFSALGTTNNLVSIDALQEFAILTSTYAAEFGRMPGAQVSTITRSGTNQLHGTLFEYFRNDALDANDWFANSRGLGKPPLRQNDFGGVLGGPVVRDRTFFFFSSEGLRVRQPQVGVTAVPTLSARNNAPVQIQPFLKAFPLPNGRDLGEGQAEFAASYSNPSTLDATSIRVDHAFTKRLTMFGRYNYAPSESTQRGGTPGTEVSLNSNTRVLFKTATITVGSTQIINGEISNDFRINYSRNVGANIYSIDEFGGAVPPPEALVFPPFASRNDSLFGFSLSEQMLFYIGKNARNLQRQFNVVDNLAIVRGAHQLKLGLDLRRLSPILDTSEYYQQASFRGVAGALTGIAAGVQVSGKSGKATTSVTSFSSYAQDTWRFGPRLAITYGLRWEFNPTPSVEQVNAPLIAIGLEDPSTIHLAPAGTIPWKTSYVDFAPRIGAAYTISDKTGRERVLRGGFGVFYDTGGGLASSLLSLTSSSGAFLLDVPFPLSATQATPPSPTTPTPPYSFIPVFDRQLKLPRTYEWNAALEQSLGSNQTVTASYVGAAGRSLLRRERLFRPNPDFNTVNAVTNSATSDYHAMQLQYRRRLSRGFQALGSYTWSHAIDIASTETLLNLPGSRVDPKVDRASADFDVRHSFSAGMTYDVARLGENGRIAKFLRKWSIDALFRAHTATPVNILTGSRLFNVFSVSRPDLVEGTPLYLHDSAAARGRRINSAAFSVPPPTRQGTLGRNALRGFGATQLDVAFRRQFTVTERLALQLRAELFNVFNHPNFGNPEGNLSNGALFGESITMLGRSLGGLNPLYQIGGPRSIQLALKLQF